MVLTGRVNKSLVTLIQQAGGRAVGLCGKDSAILTARQMVEKDIGFVGEVTKASCSSVCHPSALHQRSGLSVHPQHLLVLLLSRHVTKRSIVVTWTESCFHVGLCPDVMHVCT